MKKAFLVLFLLPVLAAAQTTIFTETFGSPSGTNAITAYETANGFDNDSLTMTAGGAANPGDVRSTSVSSGYAGASGNGNVYFTTATGAVAPTDERGFAIEGINASKYTSLKLNFAVRKEGGSGTAFATFAVQYWDGAAYKDLTVNGLPTSSSATGWYLVTNIALPAAAQIDGLKIRFLKTGSQATRLDDVTLYSDSTGGGGGGGDDTTVTNIDVSVLSLLFGQVLSVPTTSQSFTVIGAELTDNIVITPPASFELSQNNSTWTTNAITLNQSGGAVPTTTLYVRYNPAALGSHSGNITLTSTGVPSQTVALSGTYSTTPPVSGDYYGPAYRLTGTALRTALHNIIKGHSAVSYDGLYTAFPSTDTKPNGKVWDIYSDVPGGTPAYEFTHGSKKCGSYSGEADCYNREHSWPDSWLGQTNPARSDLFHMYPTDGYVNNRRSNYPYGNIGSASWTSTNGSKVGTSNTPGYGGTVFEPINEYKGDVARSAMYMSVRYYTEDGGWSTSAGAGTSKSDLLPWYANLLYSWSILDTVSVKEINRNAAIFAIQKNRNPFIDHPEFAAELWQPQMSPAVVSVKQMNATTLLIDLSRVLDSTTVLAAGDITIGALGAPTKVTYGVNNDYSKILVTQSGLATGTTYAIQLKGFKSVNGVAMNDTTFNFKTNGSLGVANVTVPEHFLMVANHPNPFNPSTTVTFEVPAEGPATVKVYTVLGQEAATLFSGRAKAGQKYTATFDGSRFVSGIYLARIESGGRTAVAKMMLMK